MKCIKCGNEVPENTQVCPFCNTNLSNNQVTEDTSIIPLTPNDYKLPKDQQVINQKEETSVPTQTVDIPAPPIAPAQDIPTPPVAPTSDIPAPPSVPSNQVAQPNIDLSNVDLNANANAVSLDLTKVSGAKEGMTAESKPQKKFNKKKIIITAIIILLIGALTGGGIYFYMSQYKSADKRINTAIEKLFNPVNTVTNYKINEGSGSYKYSYSSSKNDDELAIEANGKYAYNLPNKQIDLIANFTRINDNQELLNEELNTELYLYNDKAYLLLSNFKDEYIYTDINTSYDTIKDIESRFNNPEELLIFKITNKLFDSGLEDFSKDYNNYIDHISKNQDIDYKTILLGIKNATKTALNSGSVTQSFSSNSNVVRINVRSVDSQKRMIKSFVNSLTNNTKAMEQISNLTGSSAETLKSKWLKNIEEMELQPLENDIVITTQTFKGGLIQIDIPYVKNNTQYVLTLIPQGTGYKIMVKSNDKEVANLIYKKTVSKASTTETNTFVVEGKLYDDEGVENISINLELVKDVNPVKIDVVTRDSIDYKILTPENYNEMASKIEQFGNLGVLFKSHYKGYQEPENQGDENVLP